APHRELCCGIVGSGLPDTAASRLPRIILVLPRLTSRIAGLRYHIPSPQFLAGSGFEGGNPTACPRVSRPVCDKHLVFSRDRRRIESFPGAELVGGGHHLVPDNFAVVAFDGNQASVGKGIENEIFT